MPIKKLIELGDDQTLLELHRRLAAEWANPTSAGEPVIVSDVGGQNRPTRLYVIWSDWDAISQRERSEIVMSAYEHVAGTDAARRVTIAMGLTPAEANRMGIRYQ